MADNLKGIWVFDKYVHGGMASVEHRTWNLNFTSNGMTFTSLAADFVSGSLTSPSISLLGYLPSEADDPYVFRANQYSIGGWSNDAYRTIYITSSYAEVENADTLVTFLSNRATFTPTDADIEIPMNSSKGVVLKTSGKKCENDIKVTPTLEEITITESGTYTPTKVGYGKVTVNIAATPAQSQEKTVNIEENGTTVVTPDDGYALSKVTVNVAVEASGGTDDSLKYLERNYADVNLPTATRIKNYAFYSDTTLTNISMPNVTNIGSRAFQSCTKLAIASLPDGITGIGEYAFSGCTELALTSLPSGLNGKLNKSAFDKCSKLAINSIPEGVTQIELYAFRQCTSINNLTFPESLNFINNNAFDGCIGLSSVTFKTKPSNGIMSSAFNGCTNLTTINVPWAEGAVSNAPWGATNATINYNYTGG